MADQLERLIETLEDPAAREKMVGDLRLLLAAQVAAEQKAEAERSIMAGVSEQIGELGRQLRDAAEQIGDPRRAADWLAAEAGSPERRRHWAAMAWQLALALGAGLVLAALAGWLLRGPRRRIEARPADALWRRLPLLAARTLLELLPIVLFAAAAYGVMTVIEPGVRPRVVMLSVITAVIVARVGIALAHLVFTPLAPSLRLVPLADRTAAYLFVWSRRLINVAVYGYFATEIALQLGLPAIAATALLKLVGIAFTALLVVLVLQNRQAVAGRIRGLGRPDLGARALRVARDRIAEIWHVLALLYLAVIFVVWAVEIEGGFNYVARGTVATLVIVVVARLVIDLANRGISGLFRIGDELRRRFPFIEERANRYLPALRRVVETLIQLVALAAILQAWQLDLLGWLASDLGRDLVGRVATIVLVLAVSLVVWEVVSGAINIYLERKDAEGGAVVSSARARTLLPLIRNALLVVISVMAVLMTLSELGINIGPLLAGAGVIGLAVGFGAQTLVKDFITGMFILFEDAVQVGDVASLGGKTGVVEGITVRTVRLRDLSGTVYTIPFSAVDTIDNLTKDFSYAVLDVGVAYREDVDHVIEVLEQLGAELRADPEHGPNILEDLEVLGLDQMADSAIVVRVRFKTLPIKQWSIKRAFNRLIKRRFDELGIEIPFPHRTIYFGVDQQGNAPPLFVQTQHDGAAPAPAAEEEKAETRDRRRKQPVDLGDDDDA